MLQGDQLWHRVQAQLQANLSKPTFETWIRPARCGSFQADRLVLLVPNSFAGGWLRRNYLDMITAVACEIAGRPLEVRLEVDGAGATGGADGSERAGAAVIPLPTAAP
ncbi:MAG: DnaA N-terminal domain-containing protein, partial [Prochlorococcaceae cyanobacterium]